MDTQMSFLKQIKGTMVIVNKNPKKGQAWNS